MASPWNSSLWLLSKPLCVLSSRDHRWLMLLSDPFSLKKRLVQCLWISCCYSLCIDRPVQWPVEHYCSNISSQSSTTFQLPPLCSLVLRECFLNYGNLLTRKLSFFPLFCFLCFKSKLVTGQNYFSLLSVSNPRGIMYFQI